MPKPRFQMWMIAGLLALVTLALYWPATGYDFVSYDDDLHVTENVEVQKGLTWESVKWAWSNPVNCIWHPITVLSHMADCQLFRLNPYGHHLTSVLLHAVNTGLVFLLLRGLTGALWRSLIVAALFGWHPLHVESVAWVSERKDVLSGFFGLLALIAYVRYAQGRGRRRRRRKRKSETRNPRTEGNPKPETRNPKPEGAAGDAVPVSAFDVGFWMFDVRAPSSIFYLLSLCFFALGLMSKPMLVTWPFVMLLLDYWPLGRMQNEECRMKNAEAPDTHHVSRFTLHVSRFTSHASLLLEKLPFFAVAAAASVVTFGVQQGAGALASGESLPLAARAGNALIAYGRYLEKLFWPADLAVFYAHPGHWPLEQVVLAGGVLLGLSVLVWMTRRRYPYLLIGWLWYCGTLVPVSQIVQTGSHAMADRYTYLPLIGAFIPIIWSVCELTRGWRYQGLTLSVGGGAAIVLCLALTRQQIGYWKDSEALFRHALDATENNYLAHNSLGAALIKKGQINEAIRQCQEAIRLRPGYALAHNNLGLAFVEQGQATEAISQYQEAIRVKPDFAAACYNLANALLVKNQLDEAIHQFQRALELKPDYAPAHNNLGVALARKGQKSDAIRHYQEALRLNPDYAEAHNNLGSGLSREGQASEAIRQFQEALRLKPAYAEAHFGLGVALAGTGETDQAIRQFQEALRLKPASTEAQKDLGAVWTEFPQALGDIAGRLDGQGKYGDAIRCYQAALKVPPEQVGILNNLAWLLATCPDAAFRNGREAVRLAARACELTQYAQPLIIGTLAAAQAEAGDFQAAISSTERAAALASTLHLEQVAARNRELLQLYRQNQPFHEKREATADGHR